MRSQGNYRERGVSKAAYFFDSPHSNQKLYSGKSGEITHTIEYVFSLLS